MFKRLRIIAISAFFAIIFAAGCSTNNPAGNTIPEAPMDLYGEATGTYSIQLYWVDNSDNEDNFVLYRSAGGPYAMVVETQANSYSFLDEINFSCVEVSYYLVARNDAGESSFSNRITVPLLCGPENSLGDNEPFAR